MRICLTRLDGASLDFEVKTRNAIETEAYLLQAADAYERMIESDRRNGLLITTVEVTLPQVEIQLDDEDEAEDAAGE